MRSERLIHVLSLFQTFTPSTTYDDDDDYAADSKGRPFFNKQVSQIAKNSIR